LTTNPPQLVNACAAGWTIPETQIEVGGESRRRNPRDQGNLAAAIRPKKRSAPERFSCAAQVFAAFCPPAAGGSPPLGGLKRQRAESACPHWKQRDDEAGDERSVAAGIAGDGGSKRIFERHFARTSRAPDTSGTGFAARLPRLFEADFCLR